MIYELMLVGVFEDRYGINAGSGRVVFRRDGLGKDAHFSGRWGACGLLAANSRELG